MDLALVWILGFFPIWLMCVVDYHGSRLVAFEPLAIPTAAQVRSALERAIAKHGAPQRLISDRAPVFRAQPVADLLAQHSIRHVLTRPAHPWTNGRCERIWRTFRETIRAHFWLIASVAQLRRICADFLRWYNQDRPHSSWQGRTPDEVHFGRKPQRATGMVSYFDGRMLWYRVGLG